MKVVVPISISQQVKIIYDWVLAVSGILKGSGSKSSLLIRVCPQLFLARPCLLYISTVQWWRPDVLSETGLPFCSWFVVWQSASEWRLGRLFEYLWYSIAETFLVFKKKWRSLNDSPMFTFRCYCGFCKIPQQSHDWIGQGHSILVPLEECVSSWVASELSGCEQQHIDFSLENTCAHQPASRARGIYSQVCQSSPLWAHVLPLLVLHSFSHTIIWSLSLCSLYPLRIFAEGCPYSFLRGSFFGGLICPHRDQVIDHWASPSQNSARAICDCGCH